MKSKITDLYNKACRKHGIIVKDGAYEACVIDVAKEYAKLYITKASEEADITIIDHEYDSTNNLVPVWGVDSDSILKLLKEINND